MRAIGFPTYRYGSPASSSPARSAGSPARCSPITPNSSARRDGVDPLGRPHRHGRARRHGHARSAASSAPSRFLPCSRTCCSAASPSIGRSILGPLLLADRAVRARRYRRPAERDRGAPEEPAWLTRSLRSQASSSASAASSPPTTSAFDGARTANCTPSSGPTAPARPRSSPSSRRNSPPTAGRIRFAGRDITRVPAMARAASSGSHARSRSPRCSCEFSVLDNVALAVQAHAGHSASIFGAARRRRCAARTGARRARAGRARRSAPRRAPSLLAHGEQRLLELAMALAGGRDCCCSTSRWRGWDRRIGAHGRAASPREAALYHPAGRARHGSRVRARRSHPVLVYGRVIATGAPRGRSAPIRQVREAYLGEDGDAEPVLAVDGLETCYGRARCCSASSLSSRRRDGHAAWAATAWARRRPCARSSA